MKEMILHLFGIKDSETVSYLYGYFKSDGFNVISEGICTDKKYLLSKYKIRNSECVIRFHEINACKEALALVSKPSQKLQIMLKNSK